MGLEHLRKGRRNAGRRIGSTCPSSPKSCPSCGLRGECWDSRSSPKAGAWYRRYRCVCGVRWSTYERRAAVVESVDFEQPGA